VGDVRLSRIGQVGMPVRDVQRATAFYRDILGMKYLFSAPPGLAFFDCGGVRLMLSEPETAESERHGSVLYYVVDEIQPACEDLSARGVTFTDEPHVIAKMDTYDLWMAFFKDSEGNALAIMSEVKR
jgi:methylmalonyl-CoA/ethylmalonyl-CoA epimerase